METVSDIALIILKKNLKKIILFFLVFLILADFIVFVIIILGLKLKSGDVTNLENSISGYDCAVAFYNGYDVKMIAPDEETIRRIKAAQNLYDAGIVKNMIFSGTAGRNVPENKGAQLMSEIAVKNGADYQRVFYNSSPGDSVYAIRAAADIIRKNRFQSAVFISSLLDINAVMRHVNKKRLLGGISIFRPTFYAYENMAQYSVRGHSNLLYIQFHSATFKYAVETFRWFIEKIKWKIEFEKMKRGV